MQIGKWSLQILFEIKIMGIFLILKRENFCNFHIPQPSPTYTLLKCKQEQNIPGVSQ